MVSMLGECGIVGYIPTSPENTYPITPQKILTP